jgi:branched-chain amino acid aminotransferase
VSFVQANTNGRLHPATEPSVAPLNRGFLYGDAIYEVWRTYDGVIFAWAEHWRRLRASAAALHLSVPWDEGTMLGEIRRTAGAFRRETPGAEELYIRLQITRGSGAIGLDTTLADRPDYVLLVQPCPRLDPAAAARGLTLTIAQGIRRNPAAALDPAWKTGNYLNNVLALREARARGADEVVLLNLAGELTEAAVSNLALVRGDTVVTPPLSAGLLSGITRDLVLRTVAANAGLTVRETTVTPEDLGTFAECMLLSTTKDIVPVSAIDGHRFAVGPATATARLKAAFGEYARGSAQRHPELRLF